MKESLWLWAGFNAFVLALLALDLGVFHRRARAPAIREALTWTAVWVALALGFNAVIWHAAGSQKALEFFAGYVLEKSLSVDNLFVFAVVFAYFKVPSRCQHKVLFWGILGALLMRGVMIGLGVVMIQRFSWLLYVFGAFLVFTGLRLAFERRGEMKVQQNAVVRVVQRLLPVRSCADETRFFVRADGRFCATPLLVVLVCVEVTDLMFATDSIPAIFAVTLDPFIIYSSNVFAILGLRSLYFVLAGAIPMFYYLKPGLALVLVFVGAKMLLAHTPWRIGTWPALAVVGAVLTSAILASVLRRRLRLRSGKGAEATSAPSPPAPLRHIRP